MSDEKRRLKNIKVKEVSLVDAGANNRKFSILKSKTGEATKMASTKKSLSSNKSKLSTFLNLFKEKVGEEDTKDSIKTRKVDEGGDVGSVDLDMADKDKGLKHIKDIIDEMIGAKMGDERKQKEDHEKEEEETEKEDHEKETHEKASDEEVMEFLRGVSDKIDQLLLMETNEEESSDELDDLDTEDLEDDLQMRKSKGLTKQQRLEIKKSQDLIKAQQLELRKSNARIAILEKERDNQIKKEFIKKAATYKAIYPDTVKLGVILKSLSETNKEAYTTMMDALNSAAENINKNAYMDEMGTGESEEYASASQRIEAAAQEIQKQHNGSISIEKARELAVERNPALYNEMNPARRMR